MKGTSFAGWRRVLQITDSSHRPTPSLGRGRHHLAPRQSLPAGIGALLALLVLGALVTACGGGAPPEPMGPVASRALGVVLNRVPPGFRPAPASGPEIVLLKDDGSRLTIAEQNLGHSFTLLDLAREQEQTFRAAPGGEFLGSRELVAPLGPAYTARGRYAQEGQAVEESWAFVLRPDASGVLTLLYRYPAGEDSRERVEELLLVLGELEQLIGGQP